MLASQKVTGYYFRAKNRLRVSIVVAGVHNAMVEPRKISLPLLIPDFNFVFV